jgi:uncharacterized membrane protein
MNSKKASLYLIIVSLAAAAAIMLSSFFLKGTESSQTVMFLIIAVWFVPFTWLTSQVANKKASGEDSSRT